MTCAGPDVPERDRDDAEPRVDVELARRARRAAAVPDCRRISGAAVADTEAEAVTPTRSAHLRRRDHIRERAAQERATLERRRERDVISLAARPLDHEAGEQEARIALRPSRPGRELHALASHERQVRAKRRKPGAQSAVAEEVAETRGVVEQLLRNARRARRRPPAPRGASRPRSHAKSVSHGSKSGLRSLVRTYVR